MNTITRLQAAKAEMRRAEEDCPHWDYEGAEMHHECCAHLLETTLRYLNLRDRYAARHAGLEPDWGLK